MKRSAFLLSLLGGAALVQAPAMASDPGLPPEFRSGTFDIYIGTFVAGNALNSDYDDLTLDESNGLDGMAFGWGVRGGIDYITGNWVFGVVGDGSFGQTIAENNSPDATLDMPVLGTFRARAGGKWGDTLLYLTGGYALAEMDLKTADFSADELPWAHGWTVGAGFDYALTGNVSLGLEYLYISLDDVEYPDNSFTQEFGGIQTIRLGIDYKFHI